MSLVQIGPSILTADLLELGKEIARAEAAGVDFIHLDIMDGRYVPNITFGPVIVEAVRRATSLPLDVHLMIEEPEKFADAFVAAGADSITFHIEACRHAHAALTAIRSQGVRAGLALNPSTSLSSIEEILPSCDQVLLMTVNPGFGGQTFIPYMLGKIERLKSTIDARSLRCDIEVDGGIKASNIAKVVAAGVSMIVAGSAIFSDDLAVEDAVSALRQAITH